MGKRDKKLAAFPVMLAVVLMFFVGQVAAYEWFYDPASSDESGNCTTCHTEFNSKGDLHRMHTDSFTGNVCDSCHYSSNGDNPKISIPATDGRYGCVGCHGNDYGKRGGAGEVVIEGYNMIKRHVVESGATVCLDCHTLSKEPIPESVPPPYYGTSWAVDDLTDACNPSPDFFEDGDESWKSPDPEPETLGLDNDGDGLYDAADPDCDGLPPRVVNVGWTDFSNFDWTVLPVGGYDVMRGNLKVTSGARRYARNNGTWLSSNACASSTVTPNQFADISTPQRGRGWYYIVRSVDAGVGTCESHGPAQQGSRDATAPVGNCP